MGLKNLYDAKVVTIHLLGKAAEGDLKRPFKTPSMFGGMCYLLPPCACTNISWSLAAPTGPQTDKAAIDEAEKRVGKKEE